MLIKTYFYYFKLKVKRIHRVDQKYEIYNTKKHKNVERGPIQFTLVGVHCMIHTNRTVCVRKNIEHIFKVIGKLSNSFYKEQRKSSRALKGYRICFCEISKSILLYFSANCQWIVSQGPQNKRTGKHKQRIP